jgi:hypothetical protein
MNGQTWKVGQSDDESDFKGLNPKMPTKFQISMTGKK